MARIKHPRFIAGLVFLCLTATIFPTAAFDTVTFHGSSESRTGFFPATDNPPVINNELKKSVITSSLIQSSPVTSLVKYNEDWYKLDTTNYNNPDDYTCVISKNEQYIALPCENVLTVYNIKQYFIDEWASDVFDLYNVLKWSYTFNSPIIGTPVTFNLKPPTATEKSIEGLFVLTTGFINICGNPDEGNYILNQYNPPELAIFNIKTGECILYKELIFDDNYKRIYSSPIDLGIDKPDENGVLDGFFDEIYFYFTTIDDPSVYENPVMNIVRVGIEKDENDYWQWIDTSSEENFGVIPIGDSPPSGKVSYSSPAIIGKMDYKYGNLDANGNSEIEETIGPYIVQCGLDGYLYVYDWDSMYSIVSISIEDINGDPSGNYIHCTPITYITPSTSMVFTSDLLVEQGFLAYIDVGIENYISNPALPSPPVALYVRFALFLEIYKDAQGEYQSGLQLRECNHINLRYRFATTGCMALAHLTNNGYTSGQDTELFMEFVETWDCIPHEPSGYSTSAEINRIFAEVEMDRGSEIETMLEYSRLSDQPPCKRILDSYITSFNLPIIPSPTCTDRSLIVLFGNIMYLYDILQIDGYYSRSMSLDTTPSYYYYLTALTLSTPCISVFTSHQKINHWVPRCPRESALYCAIQIHVITANGEYRSYSQQTLYHVDMGMNTYWISKDVDLQWYGYQRGSCHSKIYSRSGHQHCWISNFVPSTLLTDHIWETKEIDPAISSPICISTSSNQYVVSIIKNVLVTFNSDLTPLWKVYLTSPVYGTPIVIKSQSGIGNPFLIPFNIDLLVVLTRGRSDFMNPSIGGNVALPFNEYPKLCLFRLSDGKLMAEYSLDECYFNAPDIIYVFSSPLYYSPCYQLQPRLCPPYIFFTAFTCSMDGFTITTNTIFRFSIQSVSLMNPSLDFFYADKFVYTDTDTYAPPASYVSYSSPTWVRNVFDPNTLQFVDDFAYLCVGINQESSNNFLLIQHDDFTNHIITNIRSPNTSGGIRFSTPTVAYHDIEAYIFIGTDQSESIPPYLCIVSILAIPGQWQIASDSIQLTNGVYSSSPAFSIDNDFIFITTSDMAAAQSTNLFMVTNPMENNGIMQIVDSEIAINTKQTFGMPASTIATTKNVYLPIGQLMYYVPYTNCLGNKVNFGTPIDSQKNNGDIDSVFRSASIGMLSIDSGTIYSYCSDSKGEIRRWESP